MESKPKLPDDLKQLVEKMRPHLNEDVVKEIDEGAIPTSFLFAGATVDQIVNMLSDLTEGDASFTAELLNVVMLRIQQLSGLPDEVVKQSRDDAPNMLALITHFCDRHRKEHLESCKGCQDFNHQMAEQLEKEKN